MQKSCLLAGATGPPACRHCSVSSKTTGAKRQIQNLGDKTPVPSHPASTQEKITIVTFSDTDPFSLFPNKPLETWDM